MIEGFKKEPVKFKKFKKRDSLDIINDDNPFVSSEVSPIASNSFIDKLKVLIESIKPLSQGDHSDSRIKQFSATKIIDWNENSGRFALAENILKQNEAQFIQMKQRMQVMADADGCGGVRERTNLSTRVLDQSNVIASNSTSFINNKHHHKDGESEHCQHNNDYGSCPKGCKKAA